MIKAFGRLCATGCTARLLILGEGELRESLEALVKECGISSDKIQMLGFVSNPFAYLSRCAAFILTSRWEGLPGVLIEAMACGAPVLSTDCPSGSREILEDGRWGQLLPVGDEQALAMAIETVLSSPRMALPDVRQRSTDYKESKAVDAYLQAILPMKVPLTRKAS